MIMDAMDVAVNLQVKITSSNFSYCYLKLGDDSSYLLLECCRLSPVLSYYFLL